MSQKSSAQVWTFSLHFLRSSKFRHTAVPSVTILTLPILTLHRHNFFSSLELRNVPLNRTPFIHIRLQHAHVSPLPLTTALRKRTRTHTAHQSPCLTPHEMVAACRAPRSRPLALISCNRHVSLPPHRTPRLVPLATTVVGSALLGADGGRRSPEPSATPRAL